MSLLLESPYFEQFAIPPWLANQVLKESQDEGVSQKITIKKVKCLLIEDKYNPQHQCHKKDKTTPQYQLLLKMLSAIDLAEADIECICAENNNISQDLAGYQANSLLLLTKMNIDTTIKAVFSCPHPADILQNTELKKIAWTALKQLKLAI